MQNQTIAYYNGHRSHADKMNLPEQVNDGPPTIAKFITCLNAGINAWEAAGLMLVALRKEDADVFKRIMKEHPLITRDTLEVFYNIGIRTFYPMVALLPQRVYSTVKSMTYEAQKRVCSEPIEVVTRMFGDKPVVVRKSISELSSQDCRRALYSKGVVPTAKQIERLNNPAPRPILELTPKPVSAGNAVRVPKVVGRYAVRRAVGGGFCFEKTMANSMSTQRILLQGGQALIELTEYGD